MVPAADLGGRARPVADEVLVIGASGFLGRPLVASLAAGGRQVTAFCRRPPAAAAPVPARGAVLWECGDVRRPESYLRHLRPGIAVYHLAALRPSTGRRRGDFEAVNVTACKELARLCLERGVRRFVLVSSAHLYGPSAAGAPRREDDGPAGAGESGEEAGGGEPALGCYESSRSAGLLQMRRLVAEGLDAVTLCPAILFGPDRPAHRNRVTEELRRIVRGRRPGTVLIGGGNARRDLVYVDDIVEAALAAELVAPPGAELILSGEPMSHRGLRERALALAGRGGGGPTLSIPAPAAFAAAWAADRLLGHEPGCGHAAAVRRLGREWCYDSGRARQILGYRPRPLDEGLATTLRWLRGKEGDV